jgi:ABC-2 type transport system ATP-binding protein
MTPLAPGDVTPTVLTLSGVHAVDEDAPGRRARGRLQGASLALGPGVHAVLGTPRDGTVAFSEAVLGVRAPLRGVVSLRGPSPARQPALRARIGGLPPNPRLPPAATVAAVVRLCMRARGEPDAAFDGILDPLGLGALHGRSPRSLSYAEARAVELALALSTPAPLLVLLHEPLVDVAVSRAGLVRERAVELAEAGACVIVVTSSPADARALGDRIHLLQAGVFTGPPADADVPPGGHGELTVWVHEPQGGGPGSRELAAALLSGGGLAGVSWEDPGPPGAARSSTVRLRGDLEACAVAVAHVSVELGVSVEAMASAAPGLQQLRGAHAMLAARARAVAQALPPEPPPPLPAVAEAPPLPLAVPAMPAEPPPPASAVTPPPLPGSVERP